MSIMECSKCLNHFDSDYEGHNVEGKEYCDGCVPGEENLPPEGCLHVSDPDTGRNCRCILTPHATTSTMIRRAGVDEFTCQYCREHDGKEGRMDNNPLLKFYQEHGISPVHQDVEDMTGHLARRAKLYRALGMPLALFKGQCVMEIGPGGGYNSLAFFEWGADSVDFVEPNPTGREELTALLQKHQIAEYMWGIDQNTIEALSADYGTYPIVIAEGFLSELNDRGPVLKALGQRVAPGGVMTVTCADEISQCMEVVKRLVGWRLIHAAGAEGLKDQTKLLSEAFAGQLVGLGVQGTRSVEDWVVDVLLNPSMHSPSFNMLDALEELSGLGFQYLGSSPNMFTNLSWYKNTEYDELAYMRQQFWRRRHLLLDYKAEFSERSGDVNVELAYQARLLKALALLAKKPDGMVIKTLEAISQLSPSVRPALDEAIELLTCRGLDAPRVAASSEFLGAMGRGMQYMSFVKREEE